MFTPVRIRGKKSRKNPVKVERDLREPTLSDTAVDSPQGHSEELDSRADIPPSSDQMSKQLKLDALSLSRLELLPLEILHSIFLLSENLNLPKTSAHIGSALASTHTRTELVVQAFGCQGDSSLYSNTSRHTPPAQESKNRDLQTALLRQKWLSYDFFTRCQKKYMLQRAIGLYHDTASGIPQDIQASTVAKIIAIFDDYYNLHDRVRKQLKIWLQDASPAMRACEEERSMELPEDFEFKWMAGINIEHTIALLRRGAKMEVSSPTATHEFCMPSRKLRCLIPDKLLHGPWTNERGQFLQLLSNSSCSIDRVNSTSGEVIAKGLEDAIRESNLVAIETLVEEQIRRAKSPQVHFYHHFEPAPHDYTDAELEQLIAPQSKWNFQFRHRWEDYPAQQGKSKALPTTRHLRIAVLEEGCDLRIVKALLRNTYCDINYYDGALMNWALRQKAAADDGSVRAAGQPMDKGSTLLRLLDDHHYEAESWSRCEINNPVF